MGGFMALIACPDCGTSHSDSASECPKCGYRQSIFLRKLNMTTVVVVAVIVFVIFCAYVQQKSQDRQVELDKKIQRDRGFDIP